MRDFAIGRLHPVPRLCTLIAAFVLIGGSTAAAQGTESPDSLRVRLQRIAGAYPIRAVEFFARDSARVVVEDSARTVDAVQAGTWMFGPPVTAAEADSCPPQKVLGRRIARELWRQQGRTLGLEEIVVRVHGSSGRDRLSYVDMAYGRAELDGQWAGDQRPLPPRVP